MEATFDPRGLVALAVVAAAVAAGLFLVRRRSTRGTAARRAALLPVAARRIRDARPGSGLPDRLPTLASPLLPMIAPEVLVEGNDGAAPCYLFDAGHRVGRLSPGYNVSTAGVNHEVYFAAHTLLAWKIAGGELPPCRVVPNSRLDADPATAVGESARQRAAGTDPATSARAKELATAGLRRGSALRRKPETWAELRGQSGALAFPSHPDFEDAYRVLGEPEDAVRRLFTPDVIDALLGQPGVIAECSGEWLFVSLNPRVLSGPGGYTPGEFLTPGQVELLVRVGLRLREIWLGGAG